MIQIDADVHQLLKEFCIDHNMQNLFVSGIDLNRVWNNPIKETHDAIYYIKDLIREIKK